ncbi:MAG: hypothetical protein IPK00_22815 [Deltaproteobacteria bacterium]|nr:hypothetical protein [Deltaproteobacteria bacterium]
MQLAVVQAFPSSGQVTSVPVQVPLLQLSPVVQSELSEQVVPLGTAGWTQPVAGLHESVVHPLPSLQASWPEPDWQAPPAQTSPVVHALPSLQEAVLLAWKQAPVVELQASSVQGFESLQFSGLPDRQTPALQKSLVVQRSPSLQGALLLTC